MEEVRKLNIMISKLKNFVNELKENSTTNSSKSPELNSEEREIENMKALNADSLLVKRAEPDSDSETDEFMSLNEPIKKKKTHHLEIPEEEKLKIKKKRKKKPLIQGCNSIENYIYLNKIHEGSFGVVFRAIDKITGNLYAIKNVKIERKSRGFPYSAIREINALLSIQHPNIITMREVVTGSGMDKIYVVMEYMENELKNLMENLEKGFTASQVKCLMKQLLGAIDYLHSNFIIHRDLKTSNLLYGKEGILKVCDFGLARKFSPNGRPCSGNVVTLWYRAPELLLGCSKYDFAIDMWSVGCIFAEMILGYPLFRGKSEFEQLELIFRTLGMPNDSNWPGFKDILRKKQVQMNIKYSISRLAERFQDVNRGERGKVFSQMGFDLLSKMLHYDPKRRISAKKALEHPWFKEEPKACKPEDMPKYKSFNTISREKRRRILERQRKVQALKEQIEMEEKIKQEEERKKREIEIGILEGGIDPLLASAKEIKLENLVLPPNLIASAKKVN